LEGLATRMKTAVLATLPDAAVTVPDTVNVPEPVTELGATLTVTESVAASAANGETSTMERVSEATRTVLRELTIDSATGRSYI
jgi:hypothetical protein